LAQITDVLSSIPPVDLMEPGREVLRYIIVAAEVGRQVSDVAVVLHQPVILSPPRRICGSSIETGVRRSLKTCCFARRPETEEPYPPEKGIFTFCKKRSMVNRY
jgi:hypothetical protein